MKVLVSNEFYELFRGDKDFIIPRLIAQKLGHQVFILCPTKLSLSDEKAGFSFSKEMFTQRLGLGPESVKFHSPLRLVRKTHNEKMPFLVPLLSYLIQMGRIRPDFIVESIYTTLTPRSLLNWLYCAIFHKGRVLLDSGDEGHNRRLLPLERRAICSARKIFTYSQGGVRRITEKYRVNDPEIFFIHLKLLDPERFCFQEQYARNEFTVGYVGRLLYIKGFDKYIELAQTYSGPSVRFLAVGPNVDGFLIPACIEHRDYVENARISEVYSAIDLLVQPDKRQFLGYLTVEQEALMCGAAIATGTLNRSFYPKEEGIFFFDPTALEDLVAHITRRARQPFAERITGRRVLSEEYRKAADPARVMTELKKQMDATA